jgi:hypothetical protein
LGLFPVEQKDKRAQSLEGEKEVISFEDYWILKLPLLQGCATLLAPRATLETRREPRASTSTFRLEQVK